MIISKNQELWRVEDAVTNAGNYEKQQNWHYNKTKINIISQEIGSEILSLNSSYYGEKEKGFGISFSFKNNITTTLKHVE